MSTNPTKPFHMILALSAYNLDNNNDSYNLTNYNKCKQDFNIIFTCSCLLAGNCDQKEVNLSFASCGYPDAIKLNRL